MAETEAQSVVCIGGGHGLGRLMSALAPLGERLCGIVATTDNGGSTGRLRHESDTIAWGDLRNCLNQLCAMPGVTRLLFEYRFHTTGDLNGHNLGNLMLYALDQMSVRPTDAIQVMRELLQIKPVLLPMADQPVTLVGRDQGNNRIVGEVEIDQSDAVISALELSRPVSAPQEALDRLAQAQLILLSPGSFMTSVMPSLLVEDIARSVNQSSARLVLMVNLEPEVLGRKQPYCLSVVQQLSLLAQAGVRPPDLIVWPESRPLEADINPVVMANLGEEGQMMHDGAKLFRTISSLLN